MLMHMSPVRAHRAPHPATWRNKLGRRPAACNGGSTGSKQNGLDRFVASGSRRNQYAEERHPYRQI